MTYSHTMQPRCSYAHTTTIITTLPWLLLLVLCLSLSATASLAAETTSPGAAPAADVTTTTAVDVVEAPVVPFRTINFTHLFWHDAAAESRLLDYVLGSPLAEASLDLSRGPNIRQLKQAKRVLTQHEQQQQAAPLEQHQQQSTPPLSQQQQQKKEKNEEWTLLYTEADAIKFAAMRMIAQRYGPCRDSRDEQDACTAVKVASTTKREAPTHYNPLSSHLRHKDEAETMGGSDTRKYTKLAELAALLEQLPPHAVGKAVRRWRGVDWPLDLPKFHLVYAEHNRSALATTVTRKGNTHDSASVLGQAGHDSCETEHNSGSTSSSSSSSSAHVADKGTSSGHNNNNNGVEVEEASKRHRMVDSMAGRMATLEEVYDALASHPTTTTIDRLEERKRHVNVGAMRRGHVLQAPVWHSQTTIPSSNNGPDVHFIQEGLLLPSKADMIEAHNTHDDHPSSLRHYHNEDGAHYPPRSYLLSDDYNEYNNDNNNNKGAATAVGLEGMPRMPLTQFRESVVDVDDVRAIVQLNITTFGLTVVRFTGHKGNVINSVAQLRSSRYDRDVPPDNCQGMALSIQLRTKWTPATMRMRSSSSSSSSTKHNNNDNMDVYGRQEEDYDVTMAQYPYVRRSLKYKTATQTNDNNNARYGDDRRREDNSDTSGEEGAWSQLWNSFALLFESSAFCEILPSISMRVSNAPREEYYYLVVQSGPGSGFDRHTVSNCLMEVFIDQSPARRQLTLQLLFALVVPIAVLLLPMPFLLWRADYVQEFMIDMDFTEWIWSPPYVLRDAMLAMASWLFTKLRNCWVARKARQRQLRLEAQHKALLQGFFGASSNNNNTNTINDSRMGVDAVPYLPVQREGDERGGGAVMAWTSRPAPESGTHAVQHQEGEEEDGPHVPRAREVFLEDRTQVQAARERPLFALPHNPHTSPAPNNNNHTGTGSSNDATDTHPRAAGPPHAALPPPVTDSMKVTSDTGAKESHDVARSTTPVTGEQQPSTVQTTSAKAWGLHVNSREADMTRDAMGRNVSPGPHYTHEEGDNNDTNNKPATNEEEEAGHRTAAPVTTTEMTALKMNVEGVMAELHYDGRAKPHDLLFPTTTTSDSNAATTTVAVETPEAAATGVADAKDAAATTTSAIVHAAVDNNAAAGDEEEDGERLCRICRDGDEDEPLVAPCACTGSVRWVHRSCLDHWRLESARRNLSNVNRCEICKQPFKIGIRRTTLLWQGSKHIVRNVLLLLACLLCTFGITAVVHGVMGGISCATPYHRASYRNMYNLEGLMLAFIVYAMAMFMIFFAYMIVYSWFRGRREIEEYIAEMHIVPPFMNVRNALSIAVVCVVLFAQVIATGYLLKLFLYATSSIIWNWEASPMVGGMLYGIFMTFALAFGGVMRHTIEEYREERRRTRAQDVVIVEENQTNINEGAQNGSDDAAERNDDTTNATSSAGAEAGPATAHTPQGQQQSRRRRVRTNENTAATAPSSTSTSASSETRPERQQLETPLSATRNNNTTSNSGGSGAGASAPTVVQDYNDIFNVPAELRVIRAVEYCPPRRTMPSK